MKTERLLIILMLGVFTLSCATTYHRGADTSKIMDNFYIVEFNGNEYNSNGQIVRFLFLKAAEAALENGYNYYYILNITELQNESNCEELFQTKNARIDSINTTYLIGESYQHTTNNNLPYYIFKDEDYTYSIKIILVNDRYYNSPEPFNASNTILKYRDAIKAEDKSIIRKRIHHSIRGTALLAGLTVLITGLVTGFQF